MEVDLDHRSSSDHPDHLDRRQGVDARQARAVRPGRRRAGRPGDLLPGAVLRPLLRHHPGPEVLPLRRARRRADRAALRGARQGARHGDGPADLRGGADRRLLQHRGGRRRRRHDPRQVPQAPHPAPGEVLGEVLLPARQPRLPGLRHRGRQGRRLHLLRPALPRGLARARAQRRADGLQPQRHQARPVQPALGDRGPVRRGRQRLLRPPAQPGRPRGQRVRRRGGQLLRHQPGRRPARQLRRRARLERQGGAGGPRPRPGHGAGRCATTGSSTATAAPTPTPRSRGREGDRDERC